MQKNSKLVGRSLKMKKAKLIVARKAMKMSQADVATYLKISQTQYQKRESGTVKITRIEWQRIAQLLEVSVADIFEEHMCRTLQRTLREELEILKKKVRTLEQKI